VLRFPPLSYGDRRITELPLGSSEAFVAESVIVASVRVTHSMTVTALGRLYTFDIGPAAPEDKIGNCGGLGHVSLQSQEIPLIAEDFFDRERISCLHVFWPA